MAVANELARLEVVEPLPQAIRQSQPALADGLDQGWTCAAYERDGID